MARICLAVVLAIGAAPVQAQPSPPAVTIQPSIDSAAQRETLRAFSTCVAKSRPLWARQTLSYPYLSDAQAEAAAEALTGSDKCVPNYGQITVRTSGVVGNLAEYFLRAELEKAGLDRLTAVLQTVDPLNASEDFALCVAARDPTAARDLALSVPGSSSELQAFGRFAPHVRPCVNDGQQVTVDLQSLRALVSVALYRGTTTVLAARN